MNRPHLGSCTIALALVGACWSAASRAQPADGSPAPVVQPGQPTPGGMFRLSDRQRDAILDGSTTASAAAARGELAPPGSAAAGIHGEMGVLIGSNGTRAAYGTAAIPLGAKAGAVVSFEHSRTAGYPR